MSAEAKARGAEEIARSWHMPDRGTVGILSFILAETALFTIFVVAYIYYMGQSLTGPYPKDVLEVPVIATICLLSSSLTVYLAERALARKNQAQFLLWWVVTIVLGLEFLTSTGLEWWKLIYHDHLTISTNLFGSTFYSLVGLHASHVTVGMFFLLLVFFVTLFKFPIHTQERRVRFLSWYWHFVDAVWVVVFTTVYIVGR